MFGFVVVFLKRKESNQFSQLENDNLVILSDMDFERKKYSFDIV